MRNDQRCRHHTRFPLREDFWRVRQRNVAWRRNYGMRQRCVGGHISRWAFRGGASGDKESAGPGQQHERRGRAGVPGKCGWDGLHHAASGNSIRKVVPRPTSEVKSIEPL